MEATAAPKESHVDLGRPPWPELQCVDTTFWNSVERAELEVFHQGPLRPTLISIEHAGYNLRPLVRWIVKRWVHVRHRVRKVFSHYGALLSNQRTKSGRDPCNRIYSLALIITSHDTLTNHEFWEISRRNLESLGDLLESILGYAWWLRHRSEVHEYHEFVELLREDLDIGWKSSDFRHCWDLWVQRVQLMEWAPWVERLVLGVEQLSWHFPLDVFYNRSKWEEAYESLRRDRPPHHLQVTR